MEAQLNQEESLPSGIHPEVRKILLEPCGDIAALRKAVRALEKLVPLSPSLKQGGVQNGH